MLLSSENVNQEALQCYAREAADFGTNYQLPTLDFAMNHCGQPDVAMFDFTSMHASENAALVRERFGHQLLVALVGDSLLEVRNGKTYWVKSSELNSLEVWRKRKRSCYTILAVMAGGSVFPGQMLLGEVSVRGEVLVFLLQWAVSHSTYSLYTDSSLMMIIPLSL